MIHPLDIQRIAQSMADPNAIVPANDDAPLQSCSWQQTAEFIATVVVGSFVLGLLIFAWIAQ